MQKNCKDIDLGSNVVAAGLDYAHGNVGRLFLSIFWPTLIGMVFNALLTIIDGIFVGQGVGPDGIASVNIIAPLYMVVTGIGLMFGIGASVVSGVALSQGESRRASVALTQAMLTTGVVVLGLCILLLAAPRVVAKMLGCSEKLMPHAMDYLLWLVPGLFFILFQMIGMMVIRLDGSPKYAMMCNVVPAVINIVLDWWLVFPMDMGVKGASIATSASIVVGAVMVLSYFKWFSYAIRFVITVKGLARNIGKQMAIGLSAFIAEVSMSIMMLTGNYVFMTYFGESGVAAFSIACYLFPFIFMMSNSVAQSAQPIISYNYGAGNRLRVDSAFRISIIVASIFGALVTASIGCGARHIVGLFIDQQSEAASIAVDGLPIYGLSALFFALNISFIGYYQSLERAVKAAMFTLLRGVVYLVPLFIVLPMLAPEAGLWWAIPASEMLTFATILATYLFTHKRLQK